MSASKKSNSVARKIQQSQQAGTETGETETAVLPDCVLEEIIARARSAKTACAALGVCRRWRRVVEKSALIWTQSALVIPANRNCSSALTTYDKMMAAPHVMRMAQHVVFRWGGFHSAALAIVKRCQTAKTLVWKIESHTTLVITSCNRGIERLTVSRISKIGLECAMKLPNLRHLDCGSSIINISDAIRILSAYPGKLESLVIDLDASGWRGSERFGSRLSAGLRSLAIGTNNEACFSALSAVTNLVALKIMPNISVDTIAAFAARNPNLAELEIDVHNGLRPLVHLARHAAAAKGQPDFPVLKNVRKLTINCDDITDNGHDKFVESAIQDVRELVVSNTPWWPAVSELVAKFKTSLRSLTIKDYLAVRCIDYSGIITALPLLEKLDIRCPSISTATFAAISVHPGLTHLAITLRDKKVHPQPIVDDDHCRTACDLEHYVPALLSDRASAQLCSLHLGGIMASDALVESICSLGHSLCSLELGPRSAASTLALARFQPLDCDAPLITFH